MSSRKAPPSTFNEYVAALNRTRSTAATEAALSQSGAVDGEEPGLLPLRAGVGVLALIGLELCAMTYGFVYPTLRVLSESVVARLDLSSSLTGLALRAVPGALIGANWACGYLAIALWLVSFAEAVLFVASTLAAQGKSTTLLGYLGAFTERPLRLADLGVMLLNGPVVFATSTSSSACAPPSRWPAGPCALSTLLTLTPSPPSPQNTTPLCPSPARHHCPAPAAPGGCSVHADGGAALPQRALQQAL